MRLISYLAVNVELVVLMLGMDRELSQRVGFRGLSMSHMMVMIANEKMNNSKSTKARVVATLTIILLSLGWFGRGRARRR